MIGIVLIYAKVIYPIKLVKTLCKPVMLFKAI